MRIVNTILALLFVPALLLAGDPVSIRDFDVLQENTSAQIIDFFTFGIYGLE